MNQSLTRQERLNWCIIFTKQSLRDCGFWRFRYRRKLRSALKCYELGKFPN